MGGGGGGAEEAGDEMKKIIKTKAETCKKKKQEGAGKVLEALAELRCECLLGTFLGALCAPSKSN